MEMFNIYESIINEGINVFHGTDRSFNDFDINKVGSGDGKNLGGWGIYFSDSEEVSRRYFLKGGFIKEFTLSSGNYFDLDEPLDEGIAYNIVHKLKELGIDDEHIEQFQSDYIGYIGSVDNKQTYDWLAYVLGSEKNASLFLESMGYLGNTFMDKWETTARNYVVFNPKYIRKDQ